MAGEGGGARGRREGVLNSNIDRSFIKRRGLRSALISFSCSLPDSVSALLADTSSEFDAPLFIGRLILLRSRSDKQNALSSRRTFDIEGEARRKGCTREKVSA